MSDIKFKSINELYERITPALRSKVKDLHKDGYNYIHEEDLWNYLKTYKWIRSSDLDLGTMVNDIFMVDVKELDDYVKSVIKRYHRHQDLEEI